MYKRQVVQSGQVDVVVNALVGYAGLMPTIAAVEAGKKVALANKETLVAGGCYVMPLAARHKAPIVPIDSEPVSYTHLDVYKRQK